MELKELGLIKKIPRLAVINASGANTLNELFSAARPALERRQLGQQTVAKHYAALDEIATTSPHTIASAIEISRPVNLPKALRALDVMNGVVREVTDDEILEHRAMVAALGLRLRTRQRRQRRRAAQAAGRAGHLAGRTGRLHPHRPRAEGPQRHGQVPHRHRHEGRAGLGAAKPSRHGKLVNRPIPVARRPRIDRERAGRRSEHVERDEDRGAEVNVPIREF